MSGAARQSRVEGGCAHIGAGPLWWTCGAAGAATQSRSTSEPGGESGHRFFCSDSGHCREVSGTLLWSDPMQRQSRAVLDGAPPLLATPARVAPRRGADLPLVAGYPHTQQQQPRRSGVTAGRDRHLSQLAPQHSPRSPVGVRDAARPIPPFKPQHSRTPCRRSGRRLGACRD